MAKIKRANAKQTHKKRRPSIAKWFAEFDRIRGGALFPEGRNQPILRGKVDAERKKFSKLADQLTANSNPAKRKRIKEALARIAFGRK